VKGRRRGIPDFTLSFLDVISGGFGGIILLLVLTKIGEPMVLEQARQDLDGLVAELEEELHEIRGETRILNRDLTSREEQISQERAKIARLKGDLSKIQGEFAASRQSSEISDIISGRLVAARQTLTEEMKRLQRQQRKVPNNLVGGIPVDSEYIIFIIDTSGSMKMTWSLVLEKIEQTLNIYPKVKGIQVMSDMGQYLFSQYAGKWIPDTPGRRKAILKRLRTWQLFSNSSPVEGITRAIRVFARPDKKISLYVLGDEFTGNSIDAVLETVRRINRKSDRGERHARIHGIGFPTVFTLAGVREYTGVRFATLMRLLCHENGGTFVALNSIRK
jgi:hypothetical protein